ncbi:MAG: hypothetical protein ACKVOM_02410 [Ferruginibacter sp.]
MKRVFFCLAFYIRSYNCIAQEIDEWHQYLQDSIYKSDDNNYIYLYKTKGGIRQKLIRYSLKGCRYVIATVYGDTLAETKAVVSPNLFQIVYDNYYTLSELPNYLHNKKDIAIHRKEFMDKTVNFSQLGIRYSNLHYNHFPKFSQDQISKARKNIADAMKAVNELYKLLEAFENKQEMKN